MTSNAGSLGDLQRAFQDYLLATSDTFQAAVRDTSKADRVTLLDVYRDGYALRLIEALTTDYPGVMAMAGPADFDHMARAYIAAHPSRHPSVRWYGRGLADFLASTEPYSHTPAAAEMARFEWALGEAFDSPDVTPITADALMALPQEAWETLAFTTLPSLRRLIAGLRGTAGLAAPRGGRSPAISRSSARPSRWSGRSGGPTWCPTSAPWTPTRRRCSTRWSRAVLSLSCARRWRQRSAKNRQPARAAGLLRAMVEGGMLAGFRY